MNDIASYLIPQLKNRLEHIQRSHRYLSFLIEKRFANEKLLQLEVMHILSSMPGVTDYLPEKLFDAKGKEKCDFWFEIDGKEHWLEIKTRPTNYKKPGHAKAITNGVSQVIDDIKRLRRIKNPNSRKFVMFAFYPLYEDSYRIFDSMHLNRIELELGKTIDKPSIHLETENGFFDIYFIEI